MILTHLQSQALNVPPLPILTNSPNTWKGSKAKILCNPKNTEETTSEAVLFLPESFKERAAAVIVKGLFTC